jgi:hypothetical protein
MSDATTYTGLRADPSMRLFVPQARSAILSTQLDRAAHEAARLGSGVYERLSRFASDTVHVIETGPGRPIHPILDSPLDQKVAAVRSSLQNVPDLREMFVRHISSIHQAARDGIREGMARADRFATDRMAAEEGRPLRSRDMLMASAIENARAVAAFARSARQDFARRLGQDSCAISGECSRLRRWASGMAMGAVMMTGMAAGAAVENCRRIGRFFSDGAIAVHIGATEALQQVAQNRYVRTGGVVAAVAGIAALGVSMTMPGLVHGLAGHLPDPTGIAQSIARASRGAFETHDQIATISAQGVQTIAAKAMSAGSSYYEQVASVLGHSTAGQEVIHLAGQEHVQGAASAYATHVQPLVVHATPAGTLAGHIGHATGTPHLAAAHAGHVHAAAHHMTPQSHSAGHPSTQPQFGDNTADAYNGAELVKVKLANAAQAHAAAVPAPTPHVTAAVPAPAAPVIQHGRAFGDHTADAYNGAELAKIHMAQAGQVHAAVAPGASTLSSAVPGATAPVVPVHAETLASPAHTPAAPVQTAQVAPAHPAQPTPSVSQMASHVMASIGSAMPSMPSMPSIDLTSVTHFFDFGTPAPSSPAVVR